MLSIFKKKIKIKKGQIWRFVPADKNPFGTNEYDVEIKGVKSGWINYRHLGNEGKQMLLFQNEALKESIFRYCYILWDSKNVDSKSV